jgi:PhzF family phenazine biosynthesis protein
MRIPLFHVNAFTSKPSSGNPAAVCLLDFWLDDGLLQKVAAENNLSATAFVVPSPRGYDLRWFTPRCEIQLCGHATLAAGYVVLKLLRPDLDSAQFCTRFRGVVTVRKNDSCLSLDLPVIIAKSCARNTAVVEALGLSEPSDVAEMLQGNDTYVVLLNSETAVQCIRPDFALLKGLHPWVVLLTAPGNAADYVCRYFAPSYGVPEDPVTGSAQCLVAPYWARKLGKSRLFARHLSERRGELWCAVSSDCVEVTGEAVLTMQGSLEL